MYGSGLHLFHNLVLAVLPGDIMGQEAIGEVVEVGSASKCKLKSDDRVVIPFTIVGFDRWADKLLSRIEEGQIDPSFVITHIAPLEQGPEMYAVFRDKQGNCVKLAP